MPEIRYKTLPEDKTPRGHKYRKGTWYIEKDFIGLCDRGYHCSKNIINAMNYVTPGWIAKVEVRGESDIKSDKEAWSEIRIVEWHKWTKKDSISLAIYAAELVLENFEKQYPNDTRPRDAIEAAKKVLKNSTAKNRSAARSAQSAAWSAARSAAESAAWSARSAARSAQSAARSAAQSAAESAQSAARSAAESAQFAEYAEYKKILEKCHQFVVDRKFTK